MKSIAVGCWPALLAATLHLVLLQLGGTVTVRRHRQVPQKKNIVGALRSALNSRTEELNNQKNIAHGLELEVRELQSELQSEKKALAKETAKEQTLQLRLNKVRAAVIDDGSSVAAAPVAVTASSQRAGTNVPPQDHTGAASVEADALVNVSSQLSPTMPVQSSEDSMREVQTQKESLDGADSELEAAEDAAQQEQQPPPPPAPKSAPMQSVAPNQQSPQEQAPPAPRVAPTKPPTPVRQLAQEEPPAPPPAPVAPPPPQRLSGRRPMVAVKLSRAPPKPNVAKLSTAPEAPTAQPKVAPQQYRDLVSKTKQLREARSDQAPAAPRPSPVANDAGGQKGAEASADFDALEAQLHEEDRRIQDLDRENALDAMTDSGGAPPAAMVAPSRSNRTSLKTVPAPKLELDSEAPMEDFLNVEAPGPEPTSEAAIGTPVVAASDAPPEGSGLALPQVSESVGAGLDGALSDEKFLSQMATTARH